MKKAIFFILLFSAIHYTGHSACFAVCVDPDNDGNGDLYEVSTDDETGQVTEVYDMETTCITWNGPYLLDCQISGPFNEDVTTALMKWDVSAMRPPTPEEKIMFEAILKKGATRAVIDSKRLSPAVIAYLRSH